MKLRHAATAAIACAFLLAGCSSGTPAAVGTATVTASPSVATVTAMVTVTATPVPTSSSSPTSTVPPAEAGPYLAGATDVTFPAGEAGVVSVVAQGPRKSGAYGTQWPVVVRNGTGKDVCDVKATVSATSGGKLVGSNTIDSVTPVIISSGGVGYGSAYFDTQLPDDATVEFTFTSKDGGGACYGRPAFIDEVNAIDAYGGVNLVGRIRAGAAPIGGPVSVDILCMDSEGQPIFGGGNEGFADQSKLAAGESGTFSVNPGVGKPCEQFLIGASGYAN